MLKILVSGLINIETTLRVEGFPIPYNPVYYPFFGVNTTVSGVGYNVARALNTLGDEVRLLSLIGSDPLAELVRLALERDGIKGDHVLKVLDQTSQSVILYDGEGRRQINVDLKSVQETSYPESRFKQAAAGCDLLVLCNINFSRPFLDLARRAGKLVASDVHAITSIDDPYNADFMRAAQILFMSHEWLPEKPEVWARQVWNRYGPQILVIGMGSEGVLVAVKKDNFIQRIPAVRTRAVVNSIGAGDALFSGFIHFYQQCNDPYIAIRKALVFASYKIGVAGAADGFLDEPGVDEWFQKIFG